MPGIKSHIALILAADSDSTARVDKQIAVAGCRTVCLCLPQAAVARAGGRKHNIHDQGVLVEIVAAAVRNSTVTHNITAQGGIKAWVVMQNVGDLPIDRGT